MYNVQEQEEANFTRMTMADEAAFQHRNGGTCSFDCAACDPYDQDDEPIECMESDETCSGGVEYRMALSGTGKSFVRCDSHWERRLAVQQGINERYPVHAPADFDPMYAGESWDEPF